MTEIQVGKVMLTFKGEYDSTKTYTRLDAVTYQGSSYVCLADTSDTPPTANWQLLADKGADGQPGKDGQPGSPGVTPHIDATTGNWFIGTTNTGVKAQGPAGQNGSDGKPGSNGSDGVSPHIDSATGHWFIGSTDTGVSARGPQGPTGDSAYQLAVKDGFTGTLAEWLASLKGAKGDPGNQGPKGGTGPAGPQGPPGQDVTITIDSSSQNTNKKPSEYPEGIFHEVKYISALGIDRSELDVTAQAGTQVFLTTKAYNSYARQTAEVFDSNRPITFIRTGHNSTWNSWEVMTTW